MRRQYNQWTNSSEEGSGVYAKGKGLPQLNILSRVFHVALMWSYDGLIRNRSCNKRIL